MRVAMGIVVFGLAGWLAAGCSATDPADLEYAQDGPVCMCGDGLSEADIRAAEKQRAGEEP